MKDCESENRLKRAQERERARTITIPAKKKDKEKDKEWAQGRWKGGRRDRGRGLASKQNEFYTN